MLHPSLHKLREEFRSYAKTQAPDIYSFCGEALFEDHQELAFEPSLLPVYERLESMKDLTSEATQSLMNAIAEASAHVYWQQAYTLQDEGFDEHYLANYGWFNLIAPSGPFVSNDIRLSVGYWERGLSYPNHWHEPEEIYLSVAGSALYISEGREPVRGGPGTTICHYSNQPHSAKFDEAPLVAAAFWRGNVLEVKPDLETRL